MPEEKNPLPEMTPISSPISVPVFNIVIHVSQQDGKTLAVVANLPDLRFGASSEPLALKQAITEVKRRLGQWHTSGETIPWIDPVPALQAGQQERLVPVHL